MLTSEDLPVRPQSDQLQPFAYLIHCPLIRVNLGESITYIQLLYIASTGKLVSSSAVHCYSNISIAHYY